ncbi:MAG: 50S ribosomal protein L29, partial [Gammaproteobacteria bacterium]
SRPDQIGKVRKDIARIHTIINEKIRAGDVS